MFHAFVDFKNRVKSNFGSFSLTLVDSILRKSADFRSLLRVSNAYNDDKPSDESTSYVCFFRFLIELLSVILVSIGSRQSISIFILIQLCLRHTVSE